MAATILIADDDPGIRRLVEANLRLEGYEVAVAADGEEALRQVIAQPPELVILDVTMPGVDGLEVCRRLRADARTFNLPVIMLTGRSLVADETVGLPAGADDYVLKPFDPLELVARVRTTLRRTSELRMASPLTGMPGNHSVQLELARRVREGSPLALVYADLNDFKSFNDRYGFVRGDEVITLTGRVLREALEAHGGTEAFAGHIGGDDFVLLCAPDDVERTCSSAITAFDAAVPALYDRDDAMRGHLEVVSRQGVTRRAPVVSLALGVASTRGRSFHDHREMVAAATEMKAYLKSQHGGSGYAVDGRTDDCAGAQAAR